MSSGPPRRLLIIGGTGDLSRRHLLPALTRLLANEELPPNFSLILSGIESMPVEACRTLVERELAVQTPELPADARRSLVARISYLQADVRDVESLRALAVGTEPLLVYFAIPPAVVPAAVRSVFHAGIHRAQARFILDKPFGLGYASATALNAQILEVIDERDVYRVDHFLYHHAVQELMRWRMRPDAFSPVDSVRVVDVEIAWDETRAVSDTSSYCGVVRDMIQSHLLQLAAIITMESPESITRADLARHRLAALRQISVAADSGPRPVRGRHIWDGETPTTAAAGNPPETFARLAVRSQMPRWKNVDFFFRAAKGVAESRRHIELRFAEHSAESSLGFVRLEVLAGNLIFGVAGGQTTSVSLNASDEPESASTRLLRAALSGDDTFTLHPEEPQEAWRIVEPLLQTWEANDVPMLTYRVGAAAEDIASGMEPSDA